MPLDTVQMPSKRWLEIYPELAGTHILPEHHTSPEYFEEEMEYVFRKTWLFAGIEADIPNVGDYIVREFDALKTSVVLVRGKDKKVRAFYNVCRHRCAKLFSKGSQGCAKSFTCQFHGWTYGLDGALVKLPDEDGYLDKSRLGLVELSSASWNGFIFVHLQKEPEESFDEWLAALADHKVNQFPFATKEWESWGWRCEVDADWKIVKDLFIETYHVAFVHRSTVDRLYSTPENPYHHLPAVSFIEKHHLATAGSATDGKKFKPGPIAQASVKYGGSKVSRFGKAKDAEAGLNPAGIGNWVLDQYCLFPNFNIHLFGGLWHYHLFEPIGVGRCAWENRIFFPKASSPGERFAHAYSQAMQVIVSLEDLGAAERNQAGMEVGAVEALAVHDQEIQLRFMRKVLGEFMAKQKEVQQ